jgi:hypothetical protein
MQHGDGFQAAYRALEERMRALAESDGDIFLPNPLPSGPVQHVFICMEPSLGGRPADEVRSRIQAGSRNFLHSIEDFILHFAARRYLCGPGERYHITDVSKGAMPTRQAGDGRQDRYDRWHVLLQDEIDLVATPDVNIFAVGKAVADHLERHDFQRPFTRLLHYSPQAAYWRDRAIEGREKAFEAFRDAVTLDDLITTAEKVFESTQVPDRFRDETLSQLRDRQLTPSRKKLIFNYKITFESARSSP